MRPAFLRGPASEPGPTLLVFSPMPPLENGIADYTAELLPALARDFTIAVVVDDHAPQPPHHPAYAVLRLAEYRGREAEFADCPHLYQVGNNADHAYLVPVLLRRPGVVVLHDVSLHHLIDQMTLRYGDEAAYGGMLALEYGHHGRLLAEQFNQRRWRGRTMFYALPLTREILGRSRAVVVHSLYAANKVAAQQADLPATLVRHHVAASALQALRDGSRAEARAALQVEEGTLLLVSLGFVTRAKQIETVLRFLATERVNLPPFRYLIAGQDEPGNFDVRALIRELGLEAQVHITGYIDEPGFYRCILASDIVVNLRYPSGGETSGTLIRALGMGACVVVNDIGPFAEYPDDVCAKVPLDRGPHEDEFARVMQALVRSPQKRLRLARAARAFMARTHTLAESASRYRQTLRKHAQRPVLAAEELQPAALLPAHRREQLLAALLPRRVGRELPLWAAEGHVPLARAGAQDQALLVGGSEADTELLSHMFGFDSQAVTWLASPQAPGALSPTPRRSHRLAIVTLTLDEASRCLAAWLPGLNARLHLHGHLIVTLSASGAVLPAAVREGSQRLLQAAGFTIEIGVASRRELSFVLDTQAAGGAGAAQEQWLLRGTKISEFVSPRLAALAWAAPSVQAHQHA